MLLCFFQEDYYCGLLILYKFRTKNQNKKVLCVKITPGKYRWLDECEYILIPLLIPLGCGIGKDGLLTH